MLIASLNPDLCSSSKTMYLEKNNDSYTTGYVNQRASVILSTFAHSGKNPSPPKNFFLNYVRDAAIIF